MEICYIVDAAREVIYFSHKRNKVPTPIEVTPGLCVLCKDIYYIYFYIIFNKYGIIKYLYKHFIILWSILNIEQGIGHLDTVEVIYLEIC